MELSVSRLSLGAPAAARSAQRVVRQALGRIAELRDVAVDGLRLRREGRDVALGRGRVRELLVLLVELHRVLLGVRLQELQRDERLARGEAHLVQEAVDLLDVRGGLLVVDVRGLGELLVERDGLILYIRM